MEITATPTDQIEMVNGTRCRAWLGRTDGGVACTIFVALVKVRGDADCAAFERELTEVKSDRQLSYFDNRILD